MKKKFFSIFFLVVIILGITACGKKNTEFKVDDLSIKDFKWETKESKCSGTDCYLFTLTNNSKYDIVSVSMYYRVKDNVTDEQLAVFEDAVNRKKEYTDEEISLNKIVLFGESDMLISKGKTSNKIDIRMGYETSYGYNSLFNIPTAEQFELMEPKEMKLGIIVGNKLYIAYYDFATDKWKLDEETYVADVWSKSELAKQLPKPQGEHFVISDDDEYEYELYSYGITEKMYDEYVEKLKSEGFKETDSGSSYYEGENSDGYVVLVFFEEDGNYLEISIDKD